jgi:hypothetical protein
MCGGVYYNFGSEDIRVYFPNPKAMLPVIKKNGEASLLPWGRRKEQAGRLPMGGWARLDSIYAGRWDRWFPVSVKISILQFMEKDISGTSHWFDLTKGQIIQGLVARFNQEQRVYVVTIEPEFEEAIHDRWPRIITSVS